MCSTAIWERGPAGIWISNGWVLVIKEKTDEVMRYEVTHEVNLRNNFPH